MADSDYDRRDDSDYDRRDDDRRRRPEPKKGGTLKVLLIVFGILGLVCLGVCGVGGYFYVKAVMDVIQAPEQFLGKVRAGDYQGAYDQTTAGYRGRVSLAQFTEMMKAAKLDQNTGISGQPTSNQTGSNTLSITASVGVPGKTTNVTFKMIQEGGPTTFKIDDISGPDIPAPGAPPK